MSTDLLGTPLTADEHTLVEVYTTLKDLAARDLPPCAAANVRAALAAVAVAVTDLALDFEHLADLAC
ncbi:DUF6052 family protein [Kineococcus sp. SYSU DK003]|uniref:DUF6052 family protein n=1 Tax=Kineococcus sp. SYSU DK003 TaxID=3383124 RepID=UPI003D7D1B56